ncbi:hypothetical protein AB834_03100 [PVC group bacterium (ex Bugula neritina AB1)]|nr:hypothetical protein AB834_03100 [PVC group bacterium (ex Bugula neritina AB1)]
MKEDLLKLVELEKIDREIYKQRERSSEYPVLLEACHRDLKVAEDALSQAKSELKDIESSSKKKELEIASNEEDMKKKDNQLSQIKKNEEYKAMLSQIEDIKKKNDKLETDLIEHMEISEKCQSKIKKATLDFQAVSEISQKRESEIKINQSKVEKEIEDLKQKHRQYFDLISDEVKGIYSLVLEKRKNFAIASIDDGACSACNMILLHELIEKAVAGEEILCCGTCSRILYHPKLLGQLKTNALDDVL